MDLRELKALEIAARCKIAFDGHTWFVPSQTTSTKYRVTLDPEHCECEDFQLRQQACKHVIAVRRHCRDDEVLRADALLGNRAKSSLIDLRNWWVQ